MTPIEINSAIQAGRTAFDIIRGLADLVSKSQNASEALQITSAIADLSSKVTEMQATIMELMRENEDLRRQVNAHSNLDEFKSRYRYEQGVCWKHDDDGPFCPNCIDDGVERRLNPMTKGRYYCVHHEHYFDTDVDDPSRNPHAPRSWPRPRS